ncbi:hypothetical protein B0T17DRAFT_497746 [Bombardia bombarda]|uniref:Uncharacterized protein n=1 Tax=Bombardia bombarda TaxID=252184 RepID=A0AA39WGU6_9PEZI|nr:hypothetical protein B0T17DRAFT_497746 [Bombardia bombarda]
MREIEVLKTKREKQVSSLEHALRELELNFKKKTEAQSLEHKQQHEQSRQEILQLKANYEQGFQDTKTQLEALLAQHQDELDQQSIKYEKYLDRQSAQYKAQIVETVAQMKDRIRSLEADLMEKPDEFRLVSDRTLKDRYRQLRLLVETISEPFNLGIKSLGSNVDQLDPTQFLARAGKNQTRFLLRNIFWTKIIDGFFSAPYGFGAFGSGGGKKMLFDLYCTWQRLFDADFVGYDSDSRTQEDFEPFYRDKYANGWRSATFQSIVAVVLPREGSRNSRQQSIANAHAENANQVKKSLLEALSSVCDGVMVSEEIQDKVDETVRCAGELALEFGVHKAKICFGLPGHGDTVQIGAEFVDCEDGDSGRGALEVVELAVSPSLFMIGDGRNDLITANCLWPGEIYPRRS